MKQTWAEKRNSLFCYCKKPRKSQEDTNSPKCPIQFLSGSILIFFFIPKSFTIVFQPSVAYNFCMNKQNMILTLQYCSRKRKSFWNILIRGKELCTCIVESTKVKQKKEQQKGKMKTSSTMSNGFFTLGILKCIVKAQWSTRTCT